MKENKGKELSKYERGELEPTHDEPAFSPATDIYEKEDAILVRCDMPGVANDQLEITLEHYELMITGRQDPVRLDEKYHLISSEYDTGSYRRVFKIPQLIDRDNIKARLHNGVLDIELPKAEQAKPRKIEITAGG
ncbi:MAG TPA: Hsp20/alpha crystallin family protein [Pontiella sp.]|nr:Hsp20/alpha crystallin family protein [Pontiella sp.]